MQQNVQWQNEWWRIVEDELKSRVWMGEGVVGKKEKWLEQQIVLVGAEDRIGSGSLAQMC